MCVPAQMNLPNALTLTRIFLVPLLVVVLLTKFEERIVFGWRKELVGAAIFALASFTDWLDGYTPLGEVIDPLADKLLTSGAFLSLVQMGLAPAWMVAIIIGREFAVTGLRNLAYSRGIAMPASPLGKIKMVGQVVTILALILGDVYWPELLIIGQAGLWVVVAIALISGIDYFVRYNRMLNHRVEDIPVARDRRKAG
jgi:CDP-diacylglycerol--glycerol-3-phosphate 3-phosphatidyltransferase